MSNGAAGVAFELRGVRQVRDGATILDGISLAVPTGRITALIGPSGAGKTSLIRLLNRLDDPVSGWIEYGGRRLVDYPVRELRRRVGFVFQTPVIFPGTVRDNLAVAGRLAGLGEEQIETRARVALAYAELDAELADREGDRLSVGQKQRVNIARALMTAPEALLMDEPTSALDPETADRFLETVLHLSRRHGLTVIMVTHRLSEARRASDYTVMLEAGRVVEVGETAEIFRAPREARTREFLESERGAAMGEWEGLGNAR
jgi:ABC-type methionine transport system ATPase subunit